jgi:hypothetical protein
MGETPAFYFVLSEHFEVEPMQLVLCGQNTWKSTSCMGETPAFFVLSTFKQKRYSWYRAAKTLGILQKYIGKTPAILLVGMAKAADQCVLGMREHINKYQKPTPN